MLTTILFVISTQHVIENLTEEKSINCSAMIISKTFENAHGSIIIFYHVNFLFKKWT